jgi:RimJ/RimL family protein N-acetyltransferase
MSLLLLLRDVVEADLPVLFEHQIDPAANRMAAFPPRPWPAFLDHWGRILQDRSIAKQTIVADGEVAGYVVVFEESERRQIGYWIGRKHWGRGIATNALTHFLAEFPARPLFAVVAAHNLASRRVLEKCGFALSVAHAGAPGPQAEQVEEVLFELRS